MINRKTVVALHVQFGKGSFAGRVATYGATETTTPSVKDHVHSKLRSFSAGELADITFVSLSWPLESYGRRSRALPGNFFFLLFYPLVLFVRFIPFRKE